MLGSRSAVGFVGAIVLTLVLPGAAHAAPGQAVDDPPASAYDLQETEDVFLSWNWDGDENRTERSVPSLDPSTTYLDLEVVNDRDEPIRNVTFVFTHESPGVEVTTTDVHAGATDPRRAVHWPYQGPEGVSHVGVGLDLSEAEPGVSSLEGMVLFEDVNGSPHIASDELKVAVEDQSSVPAGGVPGLLGALIGSALGLAASRDR